MTGANRSPTRPTMRSLRCQSVPTADQAARRGLLATVLGQDSACHRRFRTEASDWNVGFLGEALHSRSESSAVEPGEGQMGNVGIEIPKPRWTAYDAKFFGIKMPDDVAMTVQDRAYTSPIWYTP